MPDPTFTLAAYSGLERALNAALSLDSITQQRLADYEGKIVRLCCHAPDITAYIQLGARCSVLHYTEQTIDVGLEGDLQDWLDFASSDDKASTLINSKLELTGDSRMLLELSHIAQSMDIDWEGQLAMFIGDIPAHLAGNAIRKSLDMASQTQQSTKKTLMTFLTRVSGPLPGQQELSDFSQRLAALAERTEKLQSKIDQVIRKRNR